MREPLVQRDEQVRAAAKRDGAGLGEELRGVRGRIGTEVTKGEHGSGRGCLTGENTSPRPYAHLRSRGRGIDRPPAGGLLSPVIGPTLRALLRVRSVVAVVAAIGLAACEEPASPVTAPGPRLVIDQQIQGTAGADHPGLYSFDAVAGDRIYLVLTALDTALQAIVGSIGAQARPIGAAWARPDSTGSVVTRGMTFEIFESGTYQVQVVPTDGGSADGRFTLTLRRDLLYDNVRHATPLVLGTIYSDFTCRSASDASRRAFLQTPVGDLAVYAERIPGVGFAGNLGDVTRTAVRSEPANDIQLGSTAIRLLTPPLFVGGCTATGVLYRIMVVPADRTPEHSGTVRLLGDTVEGEAIEHPIDVDTFTVAGVPGDSVFGVFQHTGATWSDLRVEFRDANGLPRDSVRATGGTGVALVDRYTKPFVVHAPGGMVMRVSAQPITDGLNRGPYRLALLKLSAPLPEAAAARLVLGDSVTTEQLETPLDVDDFFLTVPAGQALTLEVEKRALVGAAPALTLTVTDSATGATTFLANAVTIDPTGRARGSFTSTGVPMRLRVRCDVSRTACAVQPWHGSYRLRTFTGVVP